MILHEITVSYGATEAFYNFFFFLVSLSSLWIYVLLQEEKICFTKVYVCT